MNQRIRLKDESVVAPLKLILGEWTVGPVSDDDALPVATPHYKARLKIGDSTANENYIMLRNFCVAHYYQECASRSSGADIRIDVRNCFGLPIIAGTEVYLRDFVDYIDESIDLDEAKECFPELSYAQIVGAINFLRNLAEFNIGNIDFSSLEEDMIESDPEFQDQVRKAISHGPSNVRPTP